MITCPNCNGKKVFQGAGYMFHDCEKCKGKGRIEEVAETIVLPTPPDLSVEQSPVFTGVPGVPGVPGAGVTGAGVPGAGVTGAGVTGAGVTGAGVTGAGVTAVANVEIKGTKYRSDAYQGIETEVVDDRSNALNREESQETCPASVKKQRGWPKGIARGHKKSAPAIG